MEVLIFPKPVTYHAAIWPTQNIRTNCAMQRAHINTSGLC